jgi:hypothetical protein
MYRQSDTHFTVSSVYIKWTWFHLLRHSPAITDANVLPVIIHTYLAIENAQVIARNTRVCVCVCVRERERERQTEREREREREGLVSNRESKRESRTCRNVLR